MEGRHYRSQAASAAERLESRCQRHRFRSIDSIAVWLSGNYPTSGKSHQRLLSADDPASVIGALSKPTQNAFIECLTAGLTLAVERDSILVDHPRS